MNPEIIEAIYQNREFFYVIGAFLIALTAIVFGRGGAVKIGNK